MPTIIITIDVKNPIDKRSITETDFRDLVRMFSDGGVHNGDNLIAAKAIQTGGGAENTFLHEIEAPKESESQGIPNHYEEDDDDWDDDGDEWDPEDFDEWDRD